MAGNFLAKTIGLAAIGIASYDTLTGSKRESARYFKACKLDRLDDTFMRTSAINSDSTTENILHRWAKNWRLGGNRLVETKDSVVGYTSSFFNQIGNNFTTFLLGSVALFTGAKKGLFSRIKIPYIGKIAAGLLAIKGAAFVLHDLMGIGAPNARRFDIRE